MIKPSVHPANYLSKNSMNQRLSFTALFLFSFCLLFLFLFVEIRQAYGRTFTAPVQQTSEKDRSVDFAEAETMYGYDYSTRQAILVP
jgi:hypothetical protein